MINQGRCSVARVIVRAGEQRAFLERAKAALGRRWDRVAEICGVHPRTIRDWRREKFLMPYEAMVRLGRESGTVMPQLLEHLPDFWSTAKAGKIGAIARYAIYGNPGTPAGRMKGGMISQQRRRENPELYIDSGVIFRKKIRIPEDTKELAEFIGIVLGDGSVRQHQVAITVNLTTDWEYGLYIVEQAQKLFDLTAGIIKSRSDNTLYLTLTSTTLVEFLLSKGLKRGDKIAQQIDIPDWILKDSFLQGWCVRGLIDTDGSVYYHTHTTKGIQYRNVGLCFTSHSLPLLKSVHQILHGSGLNAKCDGKRHVAIYGEAGIRSYFDRIGTSNPKHLSRFYGWLKSKSLILCAKRRGSQEVEGARLESV